MEETKVVASFVGILSLCLLVKYFIKKGGKWIKVGTLDEILIYPMKGSRPQKVPCAVLTNLGLKSGPYTDRAFMLVEKER